MAWQHAIKLEFTPQETSMENNDLESFDDRPRGEHLTAIQFSSMKVARAKMEFGRNDYNQRRPHGSLGYVTPSQGLSNSVTLTEARKQR